MLCSDFNSQHCDNNSHLWRHDMSGTSCTLSFSALIVGVDAPCEMFFFDSRSTSNISRQEKRPPQSERPKYYLDVPNPTEENDDNEPLCTGIVNINVALVRHNVFVAVGNGAGNCCTAPLCSIDLAIIVNRCNFCIR